uniref:Uncharacterized protein n=1 Tax=Romanomermis culicivorax TaxID=13658 RepID=A0A915JEI2_ROMCU
MGKCCKFRWKMPLPSQWRMRTRTVEHAYDNNYY